MQKFLVESFKLSLFLATVAYCMLSVGFTSQRPAVNNLILFDAYFNYEPSKTDVTDRSYENRVNENFGKERQASKGGPLTGIRLNNMKFQKAVAGIADTTDESDSFGELSDSLKLISDSSKTGAFKKRVYAPVDSSARVKYFRYSRKDEPNISFRPKKQSKFFASPSQKLASRTVTLDSTGANVIVKEQIAGQETKEMLKIPLDLYIKLRMAANNKSSWEALAYKYEEKKEEKDLSNLITDITNIDIPLPSAGFLSIFGPPKINIKIGGAVDIHGAWRNETQEGYTASLLGNTRNEPDFKQQVQINVNGTIGDKLKIGADWNTERTFEYENQLKLNYTGYDDEIVKSVEAGNVSLQTSPLVGGSEALFGVKANFQLGPLSLTALASQKKGEVKEVSVSGGASSQNFEIEAWNYSKNHYFIDSVYADTSNGRNIFNDYYGPATSVKYQDVYVKRLEVWKSVNTTIINQAKERNVNAYISLPPKLPNQPRYSDNPLRQTIQTISGTQETGRFMLLTPEVDYTFNEYTGVISFLTQIQDDDAIAVAFSRGTRDEIIGEFITDFPDTAIHSTMILKLVKPKNLLPQYKAAWKLQLKNIYPLGARNVSPDGFELDITYFNPINSVPQNEINGVKLLKAFGLDKYDKSGTGGSDGIFDFKAGLTILPTTGEIIFPYLQPFGANFPISDTSFRYQSVYESIQTFARQDINKNRFKIVGKYSGTSSSTFSIGFNVVENSVKVLLGGRELTPGADYIVDYNIGQVSIRNDAALAPGADLKITYEQNDLFQLASKTLVGLRGNLDIADKTNLGFSFLRLNQETLSEKVRIGEEPLTNSILGMDFGTELDLPFLTKGLNNLISTRAMSSLKFSGEFAYIMPDPNTKKSTIASDNSRSIAFIDDFEGTKRTIPIGVGYTGWKDLSRPAFNEPDSTITIMTKAKSYWYNILNPSDAKVTDIWGNSKKVAEGEDQITVLNFVYNPYNRGTYNNGWPIPRENFKDSVEYHWGGMMRQLSSTATDLEEENIEFIEFWFNLDSRINPNDSLIIDLGKISEDVYEAGNRERPDDEDFINNNSLIDEGEDVGIDGKRDDQEPGYNPNTNPDPNGDNWGTNPYDYPHVNGTEGNAKQQGGNFVDTEDLNHNGNIDRANSFFRFKMPLDTNKTTNPYIVGGGAGNQRWFQVRIPIRDRKISESIGNPSLSDVQSIRFWLHGVKDTVHLRFAEMNLVGNQWQKIYPLGSDGKTPDKNDTVMVVSVINKEDNPREYERINGVISEVDHTTKGDVERNEQSLNLIIQGLDDGKERQAIKYLFKPLDVFSYKEMKLYIHGDRNIASNISSPNPGDTISYNSEVYFRFGTDTTNYYEYRMPVEAGWQEISIVFNELTALKQKQDTGGIYRNSSSVTGKPGHYYAIKGRPALTGVNFFSIGILNPKNKGTTGKVSGQVWVNELRVIGADDTKGWAYSTAVNLKLADLMTINFNLSETDPYFHRLSDRFGSRNESRNWGGSVDLDILKLLPVNLPGSNLKINYSRTEQTAKPLYKPGTDVNVESAAQQMVTQLTKAGISESEANRQASEFKNSTRTVNTSETWSLSSMKIKVPSNFWLVRETINNLTFGFNFNKTNGRSPTVLKSNTWIWNANIDYSLSFGQKNFFYLTDIPYIGSLFKILKDYKNARIFFTPQTFTGGIRATRNYSFSQSRITTSGKTTSSTTSILPNISRDFKTIRDAGFSWGLTDGGLLNLTVGYNLNISGSLTHLLYTTDANNEKFDRTDRQIWHDVFSGEFFGRPYQYQQNFELKTNPKLPSLWDINKYFTITANYSASYNWQNNFEQKEFGKSASFSNRIAAGINLKLKSLFAPLFQEDKEDKNENDQSNLPNKNTSSGRSRGRENRQREDNSTQKTDNKSSDQDTAIKDSTNSDFVEFKSDSIPKGKLQNSFNKAFKLFKSAIKWTLIDYETIRFDFNQDNQVQKTGLKGDGSGIANFWGIVQNGNSGPSRAFMLGLSQNVGDLVHNAKFTFPEAYSQKNTVEFGTSRPLWTGASLDIKWRVSWGINKSSSLQYDTTTGKFNVINPSSTGNIDRSFMALPPVVFLPFLKGGIKKVHELYDPGSSNLSTAFIQGFETLPILAKLPILASVSKYVPRPNWTLNWDGLENFSILKSFTKRVSLSHAYSSSYSEGWKIETDGSQVIQFQRITYGFQPLIGLNLTFNSLWEGNLSGSFKYSTKNGYDLSPQTKAITETFSKDIGITASYSKSGLEVPIFGIYLKNDIEASFSYSSSINAPTIYDIVNFKEEGTPQDQTMRTTMEPRIKMVISSKVTASIFYRRSVNKPLEGSTSKIQGTTTNEYGLDVRITIQ